MPSGRIASIKKGLSKSPHVSTSLSPSPFDPTRGKGAVKRTPRNRPLNTRIYTKKAAELDPASFFGVGVYDPELSR